MFVTREPFTAGYLSYGELSHRLEREYVCRICKKSKIGGKNSEYCPDCKKTDAYREMKREYKRRYDRMRAKAKK